MMKRRVTERVLVLITSIAVLLSSTGVYSVFAENYSESATSASTTVSSSSSTAAATEKTTQNSTAATEKSTTEPNVVSDGGAVKNDEITGKGTQDDPYCISSAEDLFRMQAIVNNSFLKNKYFVLTNDIDLSSVSYAQLKENKVLPGTIVSVDKAKSDAAPSNVKFILNGLNHRIYGLDINNAGSAGTAIFGYISAGTVIKHVAFENITVNASCGSSVATGVVALYNNGQITDCTVNGVSISVNGGTHADKAVGKSLTLTDATGVIAVNTGRVSNLVVNKANISVQAEKENIGVIVGVNAGTVKNVKSFGAAIKTSGCDAIGAVAGKNAGRIQSATASGFRANVDSKAAFGGIAGINSSAVFSCVASGKAMGSPVTGGIVGKAVTVDETSKTSYVKDCSTFVRVASNSTYGAVIACGESRQAGNIWSSETNGRVKAYADGTTDGDLVRDARLVVVKAGSSKTISKASLSGKLGLVSYAFDTTKNISFEGSGISCQESENNIVLTANKADKVGKLTFTARVAVQAGYNDESVVSQNFTIVVLTVPEETKGNGLNEETELEISNSAELRMIQAAPFAHFALAKDVKMPSDWEPSFLFTGTLNGNGYKMTAADSFCKAVYGKISNLNVELCDQINTAMFGRAVNAEFDGVKLTKGVCKDKDIFVGVVAKNSGTGAFLNNVSGKTVLRDCFTNVPVYVYEKDISGVAGFIGVLDSDNAVIESCGASTSITGEYDEKVPCCAAFIGRTSENAKGRITDCYATVYSDITNYALIGGGDKAVKAVNAVYSSSNEKALAAPKKFENADASKWMFEAGEQGFVTGKGSSVSIDLPENIIDADEASAKDFGLMYDSEELDADIKLASVDGDVLTIPVEVADDSETVIDSALVLVHKETGLRAEISISNGLEEDEKGNYVINCGADFAFINDNFDEFKDAGFVLNKNIDMSDVELTAVGGAAGAFSGKINGNGYTISGLKVDSEAKAALFGAFDGAEVKDIVFEDAEIKSSGSYAGVLAAQITGESKISGISFKNCAVSCNENYAGVLAGEIKDSKVSDIAIESCEVSALNNAGILAGVLDKASAENIKAENVKASADNNAGLIGSAEDSEIRSAGIEKAQLESKKNAGGIAGEAVNTKLSDVMVKISSVVSAADELGAAPLAGGICGKFSGTVKKAAVKDSGISASGNAAVAGGIAAVAENAEFSAVSADSKSTVSAAVAGGIAGETAENVSIVNSKSCAAVAGSETASKVIEGTGGVIGRVTADDFGTVIIENTNTSGSVKAAAYAGGIIGSVLSQKAGAVSVKNCVSAAKTEGGELSGHIIGCAAYLSEKDIAGAVSGTVFSSYASELSAYGNADAPETYCDLDKAVKSSLSDIITDSKEIKVEVSDSEASKYGFVFDEGGWKSESEKRIAVIDSSENQVELKAEETGIVGIVGTYNLSDDESIKLSVHFDAEARIDVVLSGEGTKESPYIVSNASELEAVSRYADENAYFTVTEDIKFNAEDFEFGGEFYNEGKGFNPIGTKENPFSGVFNGGGHTITGLVITDAENAGLFGFAENAEISGITLKNADVTADKLAAGIAASAVGCEITDICVADSQITAKSAEGSAAAIAAYADNSSIESADITGTEITACETESAYNAAYAGAVCARAVDTTVSGVNIDSECSVTADGAAGGVIGYGNGAEISDVKAFAKVSGFMAAAVAAENGGMLKISDITAGGSVNGAEFAAGIAAKADGAVKADDVVISAKITGENKTAVIAASANEDIFTDSQNSDVELNGIIYSSWQNPMDAFASAKINAYQNAEYLDAVVDVNTVAPADGEFIAVGKDKVSVWDSVKSEYVISGFECVDVYTSPENLVKYDSTDGTVTATGTAIDGAKLVMKFDNGLEAAVPLVSVNGMTGEGTNASPYVISGEDTLKLLGVYPDAVFLMNKDVTLKEDWTPVEGFSGILDGAGHEISGLSVKAENAGLFSSLSGNAVVKNITFSGAVVEGRASAGVVAADIADNASVENVNVISSSVKADDYAGAVAGSVQASGAKIASCKVTGCSVSAKNAGGIAGLVTGIAQFVSDIVDASEIKGVDAAGGAVALADAEDLTIKDCEASADISADNAGGIAGVSENTIKVISSIADGTVSGKSTEGGIIGLADGFASVTDSKSFASLSEKAKNTAAIVAKFAVRPEDSNEFAKNFAGNTVSGKYDEFEPAVMKYQNFVPAEKEIKIDLKGSGTKDDPYIIGSAADLAQIPDSSTAYFSLEADIRVSDKDYGISVDKDGNTVYGVFSDGYEPIKNFAGVFDGNGHIIKGLYIDTDSDYVGLFANITANGSVKNLHVELLEEKAGYGFFGIRGGNYVGGIAGYCDSVNGIENCSVVGSVISGDHAVGGVVGGLASSEIKDSFAVSEIKAQNKAGGIAGITSGESAITNSFAACEVNAAGGTVVGTNNGVLTLTDVMANGSSHGTDAIAVAVNNGTIKAKRVLIAGANEDEKTVVLGADEAEYVYGDITSLGVGDENMTALTTSQLTASKPEGLDSWNQSEGKYPVPAMADDYSNKKAALAAAPAVAESDGDITGNLALSYKLVNKSGDKNIDSMLAGVLIKSKVDGMTVTSDFFTTCGGNAKAVNKILVTTGGFYIDSSLPQGYEFVITAKDSKGRAINVSDAGSLGAYVECGAENSVSLVISIVKTEIPWGVYSLWESIVR